MDCSTIEERRIKMLNTWRTMVPTPTRFAVVQAPEEIRMMALANEIAHKHS